MKTTRMIALMIPVMLLFMTLARPAAAIKPEVTVETYHFEGVWLDCGSFQIAGRYDEEDQFIYMFDNDGNPIKMVWTIHTNGIAWNTVSGLTIRDDRQSHFELDLATGIWKAAGNHWHWTIPGQGAVLIEGGHIRMYPDHYAYHGVPHFFEIAQEAGPLTMEEMLCPLLA